MNPLNEIQKFNKLFNNYYESFNRFAIGYVKDKHIAEDFVSDKHMSVSGIQHSK